jgi:hypothetical protein
MLKPFAPNSKLKLGRGRFSWSTQSRRNQTDLLKLSKSVLAKTRMQKTGSEVSWSKCSTRHGKRHIHNMWLSFSGVVSTSSRPINPHLRKSEIPIAKMDPKSGSIERTYITWNHPALAEFKIDKDKLLDYFMGAVSNPMDAVEWCV